MGALEFDVLLNNTQYRKALQESLRDTIGFSNRAVTETAKVDTAFQKLGQAAAGYFAFAQIASFLQELTKVRGEFQQLEISLTTMLRNKVTADALLRQIVQTAGTTSFSLKDIGQGAKQLLAYGSAAKNVIGEIRTLGDVAAGTSTPLNDLIYLYGTLRTQGRAYAVDIRQFAGRGIPIYEELAKVLGTTSDKVNQFVSDGKVGFAEVEQAFKNMTTQGGIFAGLMEAQSKSIPGLKERFTDAIDQMLNDLGRANQGLIATSITGATVVVENYEAVTDVLGILISTYGTYRAALLLTAAVENFGKSNRAVYFYAETARALGVSTAAAYANAVATSVQARAQAALNAVMAVNPYVAAASVVVALASATYFLSDSTTAAEDAQRNLADATERNTRAREELEAQTNKLTGVIRSETSTKFAQIQAYAQLQKLYPQLLANLSLQEFSTLKAADAQRQLNAAMDQMGIARVKDSFEEARKKVDEYEAKLKGLLEQQQASGAGGAGLTVPIEQTRKALETARIEAERLSAAFAENERAAWEANTPIKEKIEYYEQEQKSLTDQRESIEQSITKAQLLGGAVQSIKPFFEQLTLNTLNNQLDDVTQKLEALKSLGAGPADGGNKAYFENEKKRAEEKLEALGVDKAGSSEWKKLVGEIRAADEQLKKYNTTVKSVTPKKVAEKDKPQPFGSIAYYEQVARKADELLKKTPSSNFPEIEKQNLIKEEAERKISQITKQLAVKTFEEELDEKRKQYALYQRWVEFVGQESADRQFADLTQQGKDFAAYLQNEIGKLQIRKAGPGLDASQAGQLIQLTESLNIFTQRDTSIDKFRKGLDEVTESGRSLTEQLELLAKQQEELDKNPYQSDYYEKRKELAERSISTGKERKSQFDAFLAAIEGSEQQRLALTKKYADLRSEAEGRYNDKTSAGYRKVLDSINKEEAKANNEINDKVLRESEAFTELQKILHNATQQNLKDRIAASDKWLAEHSSAEQQQTEVYKEEVEKRKALQNEFNRSRLEAIARFAQVGGELGAALSQANGALGQMGQFLSNIAGQLDNVLTAFDKTATSSERLNAGARGLVQLVDVIVSSARQRKDAEADYYRSTIAFQQQYNLLLNEQIGLQGKTGNPLYSDFEKELQAGIAQYDDAQKQYQDSLKKLEEGRVKNGQKNGIDWKAVGQGAGAGAGVGATVGGIIGGPLAPVTAAIGAAVGGLVGGLTGLFAGKKKKDTFVGILEAYPGLIETAADGTERLNEELAKSLLASNQLDDTTKDLVNSTLEWQKAMEEAQATIDAAAQNIAGSIGSEIADAWIYAFGVGEDAFGAMEDIVGNGIKNMVKQITTARFIGPLLDKFKEEFAASYGKDGDKTAIDDLGRLFQALPAAQAAANEFLKDVESQAAQYGIDVFGPTGGATKANPNSAVGQVQTVTQETASLLVGQSNAQRIILADIRVSQIDILGQVRQQTLYQSEIASNTRYNRHLETIERHLRDIKEADGLRATGGFGPK